MDRKMAQARRSRGAATLLTLTVVGAAAATEGRGMSAEEARLAALRSSIQRCWSAVGSVDAERVGPTVAVLSETPGWAWPMWPGSGSPEMRPLTAERGARVGEAESGGVAFSSATGGSPEAVGGAGAGLQGGDDRRPAWPATVALAGLGAAAVVAGRLRRGGRRADR